MSNELREAARFNLYVQDRWPGVDIPQDLFDILRSVWIDAREDLDIKVRYSTARIEKKIDALEAMVARAKDSK